MEVRNISQIQLKVATEGNYCQEFLQRTKLQEVTRFSQFKFETAGGKDEFQPS